jgi:AcrR family transcriptional regulator
MRLMKHGYHHGDLRNALVGEALKLLEKEGSSAFTLRDLARRVGVSCAAPYSHFEDKDALLAAVATAGFGRLKACLETAIQEQADSERQFVAMGQAYVQFGMDNPALYKLMFASEELPAKRDQFPELMEAGAKAFETLTGMLGRMQQRGFLRTGDVDGYGLTVWAHVHGLTSIIISGRIDCIGEHVAARNFSPAEAVQMSLSGILKGLQNPA